MKEAPKNANAAAVTVPDPVDWVDDRELARRTPIARISWQTWRARGQGPPFYCVGRRRLYKWPEVERWIEDRRVEPKKKAS